VHHISLISFFVMAGKTLMATIPVFCEWGPCTLIRHTAHITHFLVPVFGEGAGKFQVNVLQLIIGILFIAITEVAGIGFLQLSDIYHIQQTCLLHVEFLLLELKTQYLECFVYLFYSFN